MPTPAMRGRSRWRRSGAGGSRCASEGESDRTRRSPAAVEAAGSVTVRPIVEVGDPVLREPAREVTPEELGSPEVQALIDDMIETKRAADGAGLAAPQV